MTETPNRHDNGSFERGSPVPSAPSDFWLRYYDRRESKLKSPREYGSLTSYNRYMLEQLRREVSLRKTKGPPVRIWSAGAGIDPVSLNLKAEFGASVDLTLVDISRQCVAANRRMFKERGLDAEFIVGDLFDMCFENTFDIVMNTGLLEHFDKDERRALLKRFSESLVEGGFYFTMVPFSGARIYRFCMRRMREMGTWELGPETPMSTLSDIDPDGSLVLVSEYPVDAAFQLSFIKPAFPSLGSIILPFVLLVTDMQSVFEPVLRRVIGGYALYGVFAKKQGTDSESRKTGECRPLRQRMR